MDFVVLINKSNCFLEPLINVLIIESLHKILLCTKWHFFSLLQKVVTLMTTKNSVVLANRQNFSN